VIHPNAGGSLPKWLTRRYLAGNLSYVIAIRQYFQELKVGGVRFGGWEGFRRAAVEPGEEGGEELEAGWGGGEKTSGAEGVGGAVRLLSAFLEEVVRAKWVLAASVTTKLDCLSEREAWKFGRSLMPALKQRKTAEAGLYQWKDQVSKKERASGAARRSGRAGREGASSRGDKRARRCASPKTGCAPHLPPCSTIYVAESEHGGVSQERARLDKAMEAGRRRSSFQKMGAVLGKGGEVRARGEGGANLTSGLRLLCTSALALLLAVLL